VSARAGELEQRRAALIAQCAVQRAAIAEHTRGLATPLRVADRVGNALVYLRRHPMLFGASAAAFAVMQRRGIVKWGQRAFLVWRAWKALRSHRGVF
jgi:hypothetical protein